MQVLYVLCSLKTLKSLVVIINFTPVLPPSFYICDHKAERKKKREEERKKQISLNCKGSHSICFSSFFFLRCQYFLKTDCDKTYLWSTILKTLALGQNSSVSSIQAQIEDSTFSWTLSWNSWRATAKEPFSWVTGNLCYSCYLSKPFTKISNRVWFFWASQICSLRWKKILLRINYGLSKGKTPISFGFKPEKFCL